MSIEAMKQALEALETLNSGDTYKTHNAATALRAAIEQARSEQWWKHEVSNAFAEGYEKGRAQREWKGLTDEDIYAMIESNVPPQCDSLFERAAWLSSIVEARLKEKNNA